MVDREFDEERRENIRGLTQDHGLRELSLDFLIGASRHRYSYNFDWLGLPIIQFPADIVAIQELIWKVKPRVVIETGVARGGSLILSASILELLGGERLVVGIDNLIRAPNRQALEAHPLFHRIKLLEGSSTDLNVVRQVRHLASRLGPVLLLLDSLHTHEHVTQELLLYSPLVEKGSYIVVFDTIVERMPSDFFEDRPWGVGNNPMTAVQQFLKTNSRFVVDEEIEAKLQVTTAPSGYLRCIA